MGKSVVATNLLSRAKAFWVWFIKKSPAFIVLTSLTVVSVFGLGVGGTLAATGVISNPFASNAPTVDLPEQPQTPQPGVGDGILPKDVEEGTLRDCYDWNYKVWDQACLNEGADRNLRLMESGWTGVKFNFTDKGIYLVWQGKYSPSDTEIAVSFDVNGYGGFQLNRPCFYAIDFSTCGSWQDWTIYPNPGFTNCFPQGDTYLVEVKGAGLNFRESGMIPDGVIDCPQRIPRYDQQSPVSPAPSTPSPVATPEPSPSSTPEPSQTPTPTTEPSPSPTSP